MQVAIPMRTQMIRTLFLGLAAGVGGGCCISCSATENGPSSPVTTAPETHRTIPASSGANILSSATPTAGASASTKPPAGPQDVQASPCGVRHEYIPGAPWRALSQHVPDRACSEESDCGDGFCDRGRCAPIWEQIYGQRCTMACQCEPFLCIEGRCSSCLRHAECGRRVCGKDPLVTTVPIANDCGGVLGMRETHMPPEPARPPPPPTP
jgi:hypothetical protein